MLYHNLAEIIGVEQLKMLIFKAKMCKNALNSMLMNISIGKEKDKQTFQQFKKLLKCTLLVNDNFMKYSNDFEQIYELYTECLQQNLEIFETQGNENLFLQLSDRLKLIFESTEQLNKLYDDVKKYQNEDETLSAFEEMPFQILISAWEN